MQDYDAMAEELRSKGYTLEDIQGAVTSEKPLVSEQDVNGSEFVDGKKVDAPHPTTVSQLNPDMMSKLTSAYEAQEMERGQANAIQGGSEVNLEDMFGPELPIDLSAMFEEKAIPFELDKFASNELARMASTVWKIDPVQAETLMSEDPQYLQETYSALSGEKGEEAKAAAQEKLALSDTPEQTLQILVELDKFLNQPVMLSDLREFYVNEQLKGQVFNKSSFSDHITQNLVIAEEIQKASQEVWKGATYGGIFKDIGQLVIPFTGYAEEEINKWSVDFAGTIKKLKDAGNQQEARDIIDQFTQALIDTQTPIIERNNTLLTLQALDSLATEFRNGAYGWVDGVVTEEEVRMGVESVAFGALEVSGIGGLADVVKTLSKRILPSTPKNIAAFVPQYDVKNTYVMQQRSGSSVSDTIVEQSAIPIRKEIVAKGLKETTEKLNLNAEQAADRAMPSLSSYIAKTLPNTELSRIELNELNLSNKSINTMKTEGALQLQKDLGESGVVQTSDVVIVPNDDPASLGEFVFHVGGPDGSWLNSLEEAQSVQARVFGRDSEIVELNGKYAVKFSHNHIFNPKKDVTEGAVETLTSKSRFLLDTAYIFNALDPLRVLGEDFLSAASSVMDVNRAKLSSIAEDFSKSIKSWTHTKRIHLAKVLQSAEEKGLNGGILSKRDLPELLNSTDSKYIDSVWESYSQIREVTEELYRVTDKRFRMGLESQGWKYGVFEEDADFVRLLNQHDEIDYSERVFDVVNNRIVMYKDLGLDETTSLVKSMNTRVGPDDGMYDLLLIKNTDTKALPSGPLLNKQSGYIPRIYTETGYTITETGSRVVNGVPKVNKRVTHIVRSKADAVKAKKAAVTRELAEYERTLTNVDDAAKAKLLQKERSKLENSMEIKRSRENDERDIIWGKDSDVSFGFGSSNSKAKGERLHGSEGLAPIMDPVNAISRRINSLGRDLNHSVVASLQSRFNQRFSQFLKQGNATPWNSSIDEMMNKTEDFTIDVSVNMRAWHKYIESMREIERSRIFAAIDRGISHILENIPLANKLESPLVSTAQWLKHSAAVVYIVGRPFFQIPTNLMQMWAVTGRATAYSPYATMRGIASMPVVLAGRINKLENAKVISRVLGVPESEALPLMKFLFEESGLVKGTDFTDDILSMATDELVSSASSVAGFYGSKYVKPVITSPLTASSKLQTGALQLVNLQAFLTEVVLEASKGSFKLDAKMKEKLLFTTRKLTQTQNRSNQYGYQNSADIDGLFFQFQQHVQKMLGDLVIEPAYTAVSGKTIKRNPFAEDRRVAAAVTALNIVLFGTAGVIGAKPSRESSNYLIEEFPEIATDPEFQSVYDTARGGVINTMVSGFSDRITPAAMIDTVWQMFDNDKGAIEMMFGASGGYTASIYDLGLNIWALGKNPDMSSDEAFYAALRESANIFAGARDFERAYIAYNFGVLAYPSNLSGVASINTKEAIALAFSVTPEHVVDMYNELGKTGKRGSSGISTSDKRINDLFVRGMNRELLELQESGKYTLQNAIPIRQKWVGYAKAAHGMDDVKVNQVEEYFKNRTLSPDSEDFEKFIAPYVYTYDTPESIQNLERLANTTDNPRLRKFIENRLYSLKMFRD
jgi:hypothetical protein